MKTKKSHSMSYAIGYIHGHSGKGTNGYNPAKRLKESLKCYDDGFKLGFMEHHEETAGRRSELAKLNFPRAASISK